MKTIGLFYAMNAAKTSHIAEKIREDLGGVKVIAVSYTHLTLPTTERV